MFTVRVEQEVDRRLVLQSRQCLRELGEVYDTSIIDAYGATGTVQDVSVEFIGRKRV